MFAALLKCCNRRKNMKFAKYENFWWQWDDNTPKESACLYNMFGGKSSNCDIRNCQIVDAEDFDKLNWAGTSIFNNSRYGWLDREGKFYGCDYRHHDLQAKLVHGSSRAKLEKLGWVIIVKMPLEETGKLLALYHTGDDSIIPTGKQLEYLSNRNDVDCSLVIRAFEYGNKEKSRLYEQSLKAKEIER